MTRIKPLPWDDIKRPSKGYNVRLASDLKSIPMYWGKDAEGNYLFIMELEGDHRKRFQQEKIVIRGVEIDLRILENNGNQSLILKLERHRDRDLFRSLCNTLIENLQDTSDSAAAISLALAHLKRWKIFLSGRRARLLGVQEICGLFAELQFLRTLCQKSASERDALDAWCGPDDGQQDFIFGNTAVEVKAISAKDRNFVRISSEDQLETLCERLFLMLFLLQQNPESDQALSLNDLVLLIQNEFSDPSVSEKFLTKMAVYGYVKMQEYDEPRFLIAQQKTYQVRENFPRIIRSETPPGLMQISYKIKLEAIKPFQCEPALIWREI